MEIAARSSVVVGAGVSAGTCGYWRIVVVTGARRIAGTVCRSDGNSLV